MLAIDHPRVMPEPNSGCFLWMGQVRSDGYGRRVRHRADEERAHRVFYERERGPLPAGVILMHRCDNRQCVNPDHLIVGTRTDNSQDKVRKGRQARGPAHSEATRRGLARGPGLKRYLSAEEGAQIRSLKGTVTQREIAAFYGCSLRIVRAIHQGVWQGNNYG